MSDVSKSSIDPAHKSRCVSWGRDIDSAYKIAVCVLGENKIAVCVLGERSAGAGLIGDPLADQVDTFGVH